VGETQSGLAGYYSDKLKGRRTASGERYNPDALTTAHQTLPFGTKVKVTNAKNGKSVVLRVNDRGPTQPNRIVDISRRAGRDLGAIKGGLTEVKLEVVEAAKPKAEKKTAKAAAAK
jgi:rare lipoprotein A